MRMWTLPLVIVTAAVAVAAAVAAPSAGRAQAPSCTVWADPTAPDGASESLRQLVSDLAGPSTLGNAVLCLPPGEYALVALSENVETGMDAQNSAGDLDVWRPLEIRGVAEAGSSAGAADPDAVRIVREGGDPFRLLDVHEQPDGGRNTVMLRGLTLAGGLAGSEGDGNTGGAMRVRHADVTLENVVIRDNEAPSNGGAIDHADGVLTLTDAQLLDNTAGTDGGAVHNAGACGWDGAACTNEAAGEVFLERVRVEGNTAGRHGGGLANDRGRLVVVDCDFMGNVAGDGTSHSIWNRGTEGSAEDGILRYELTIFHDGAAGTFPVVSENAPPATEPLPVAETEEVIALPAGLSLLGWFGRATTSSDVLAQHPEIETIWWLTLDGEWVADSLLLPPALRVSIALERGTGVFVVASAATTLVVPL